MTTSPARATALAEQTIEALRLWSGVVPYLYTAPFFLVPPLWIAMLSLARRRVC